MDKDLKGSPVKSTYLMWLGCPKARIRLRAEIGGEGSSTEIKLLNIGYLHGGGVNWVVANPLQIATER